MTAVSLIVKCANELSVMLGYLAIHELVFVVPDESIYKTENYVPRKCGAVGY